jgi:hypothetical protein
LFSGNSFSGMCSFINTMALRLCNLSHSQPVFTGFHESPIMTRSFPGIGQLKQPFFTYRGKMDFYLHLNSLSLHQPESNSLSEYPIQN